MRRDLNTLRRIFRIVEWFIPYQGLDELYREIRAIVMEELDYHAEADNADAHRGELRRPHRRRVPARRRASCRPQRVLVTHFESACKITDIARRASSSGSTAVSSRARSSRSTASRSSSTASITPIRTPGTCWSARAETGGAADDRVPRLRRGRRDPARTCAQGIVELIQGALTRDTPRIVGAMKQMGFVARGANEQMFEQVIEYFHEQFQENISLDSLNLKDIKFDPQKGLESVADLRKMDISLRELSARTSTSRRRSSSSSARCCC